jgi:hypothetical protein
MRFFPWNSGVAYAAAVLADSPVGYWRLGESSGTTMTDSSGNGHDGTYVNTPTLGQTGAVPGNTSALFTAASTQRGVVTDRAALDITGALTLEAWVNCASYATNRGIIAKYLGSGNQRSYVLTINSSGNLLAVISRTGVFATAKTITTSNVIGLNTWRHVAFVYVPSTSMEIFLDGVSVLLDTTSVPSSAFSGSADLWIGQQFDSATAANAWDGLLDECAVYNTALSSARIAAHYAARNTA